MLYISRVKLSNVRCFDSLTVTLNTPGAPANWTVFVGDNSTGKSTLLRSIAMGLCDEASAAGLLKESDEGYIRRGADKATITIWLYDSESPRREFRIRTIITRKEGKRGIFSDIVRQTTSPARDQFPWDELFVSGYGAGRGVSGTGDISSYSAIDAVYNMFNYSEGLQNPELTIRRLMARETGTPIETRDIFKMLHKATGTTNIQLTAKGVRIDGPWGNGMPLRDLADGYKSAVLWVTDLVGWALAFKPRLKGPKGIRGIVLVDELEQHLHARWQRTIVDDLWRVFPNIQFLVTSHSPLIASSVGPRLKSEQADKLYVLEAMPCNRVQAARQEFMQGWRMDQVLASRAFKYQVHSDPETRKVLREGSKLAAKRSRTPEEEATYRRIRKILDKGFFSSTTPVEREGETKAKKELRKEIQSLERELFGDKAS